MDAEFLIGFGAVVVLPDYNRLVEELKSEGFIIPKPYWFAAQIVYMEAGYIMNQINEGEPRSRQAFVSTVYDDQEEYRGRATRVFEEYREKNPLWSQWLLLPRYESDLDYIVLQAADNLVYEMRKLVIKDAFNEVRPERTAMRRLKQQIWKVYKLNYVSLKSIISRPANVVKVKADISNPLPIRKRR